MISLSGAGSIAAVRLATPLTLDEWATALLLFLLLPAGVILIAARIWRPAGVMVAILLPVVWLLIAWGRPDSPLLWLVPVATGLLVGLVAWRAERGGLPLVATALAILVGLGTPFWPPPGRCREGPRVLLFGIDGATWVRIDPLVSAGKLPNFASLLETGHRAKLRSLSAMVSPRIWNTIATGCLPSVHGIDDFGNRQSELRVGRIWDQMKQEGRSFGVCGWYSTWPPLSGLGEKDFVIPSTMAPDAQTHPPEYCFFWEICARVHPEREAATSYARAGLQAFRYGVRLSTLRRAVIDLVGRRLTDRTRRDQFWIDRRLKVAFQADVLAELLRTRQPEFAAALFKPVDSVSHMYWKYLEPLGFPEVEPEDVARYGGVIDLLYVEVDCCLGRILRLLPEDADVIIVSDHGFRSLRKRKIGAKYCRIRTVNLMRALGCEEDLSGMNVDQDVYLRPVCATEAERGELVARLEATLKTAHLSGERRPMFQVRRDGGSLCLSLTLRHGLSPDARVVLDGEEHPFENLVRVTEDIDLSGVHAPDGIYLLAGASAARAIPDDSLHVVDVAPTVAALLDLPVSPHWIGRVALKGFSTADREVAEYPPPGDGTALPSRIAQDLKDRLKAVGYLE